MFFFNIYINYLIYFILFSTIQLHITRIAALYMWEYVVTLSVGYSINNCNINIKINILNYLFIHSNIYI